MSPVRRSRLAIAALGVAALTIGVTTMDEPDPTATDLSRRAAPAAGASATPFVEVGRTPADREVAFELVLAFPGREAMAAYALAVADPASPDYRRFLDADAIGRRFGLGDDDLARVAAWAAAHDIRGRSRPPRSGWRWRWRHRPEPSSAPLTSRSTTSPRPTAGSTTPRTSTPWFRPSSRASWRASVGSMRARPSARRCPIRSPPDLPAG